jgi:hypothetical protein
MADVAIGAVVGLQRVFAADRRNVEPFGAIRGRSEHVRFPILRASSISYLGSSNKRRLRGVMQDTNSRSISFSSSGRSARAMRKSFKGSIGFIGLGHMGSAMATNLAGGGFAVLGYLRHPERNAHIKALGIEPTNELAELFDCDIVITMVSDDAAASEIVLGDGSPNAEGLALGLKPGALHLSMSTISPTLSSTIAAEHVRHGQMYVAAPVFGNPDAAKARKLYHRSRGTRPD